MASESSVFISPDGVPHQFTIRILKNTALSNGLDIEVTAQVTEGTSTKAVTYTINKAEHTSYLDVFEKLSADLGLRLPQNRKPSVKSTAIIPYQEVLLENKNEGMLYGYGDPAVLRTVQNGKSCYYLLATSNDAPDSFPILRSENMLDWQFASYVFPQGVKPVWAADGLMVSDYWAPELHQVGNEYRVYFVARNKDTRELCIGMAQSAHPAGPFTAGEQPVLGGNVIDPHLYVQEDGTAYLFWKEDNNDVWPGELIRLLSQSPELVSRLFSKPEDQATASFMITLWPWLQTLEPMERFLFIQTFIEAVIDRFTGIYNLLNELAQNQDNDGILQNIRSVLQFMKTPMYAQQLSADGQTLTGDRTKVLENDLEWEAHLVEGMWVTRQQNRYYLFYAGNDFSTDSYGIGVAIADSPLGPYHKVKKPFLQSTAQWSAPGHPSVTLAPDGQPVMFLHAYFPGQAGYKQFRALLAIRLRFEPDGVYWE